MNERRQEDDLPEIDNDTFELLIDQIEKQARLCIIGEK
jgi:hypothetical protein